MSFKKITREFLEDDSWNELLLPVEEEASELEFDHELVPTLTQDWDELTWEDM